MYGEHVDLLETLAYRIGYKLIEVYQTVEAVEVEVRKMHLQSLTLMEQQLLV